MSFLNYMSSYCKRSLLHHSINRARVCVCVCVCVYVKEEIPLLRLHTQSSDAIE